MRLNPGELLLLFLYAAMTATGNIALERGATRVAGAASSLQDAIWRGLGELYLWAGLGFYVASFLLWLWLLSFIPLRYAYPVSATSLLIAPLIAGVLTRSFPQPQYWIGLLLVMAGLWLVVTSSTRPT